MLSQGLNVNSDLVVTLLTPHSPHCWPFLLLVITQARPGSALTAEKGNRFPVELIIEICHCFWSSQDKMRNMQCVVVWCGVVWCTYDSMRIPGW